MRDFICKRILLLSLERRSVFYVQEHDDARDVVHYVLTLLLPTFVRGAHQGLARALGIPLREERKNDVSDLLVFKELPHAITRKHQNSILRLQVDDIYFGDCVYSHATRRRVTEGPAHGEARQVLIFEPNAHRTHLVPMLISIRIDTAIILEDYLRFERVVGLMVPTESLDLRRGICCRVCLYQARSTIANVGHVEPTSIRQHGHAG